MRNWEIKKLSIALAILGTFSLAASAQDFSVNIDWNQNQDFQDWWADNKVFGPGSQPINIVDIDFVDPGMDMKTAMSSVGTSIVNRSTINLQQKTDVSLNVSVTNKVHIPNTSEIADNNLGNWIITNTWDQGDIENNITLAHTYVRNAAIFATRTRLEVIGAQATNEGTISITSNIEGLVNADSLFTLTTDNEEPSDEQMQEAPAPDFDSFTWVITPALQVAANLNAFVELMGITAYASDGTDATAINNGTIEITGNFAVIEESSFAIDRFEEFEKEFSNGSTLSLVIDQSQLSSTTDIKAQALAAGLAGVSDEGTVSLINNGTITINADETYLAAGIVADVTGNGRAYASNMGQIDLSEAKGIIRHQFFGSLSDNGQIEIGDWLLDLKDSQGIVPFALRILDENATGKVTFSEDSHLYIVPNQLNGETSALELGTLFGLYDEYGDLTADTQYIDGFFDKVESASNMVDIKVTGDDINHLTATATVNPEKSLGHQSRYQSMAGDLNTLLSLQSLTSLPESLSENGRKLSVIPWYIDYRDSSSMGFDSDGGGIILRAAGCSDQLDAALYLATAKETADSHNQALRSDTKRYAVGGALNYHFNDFINAGIRIDAGIGSGDWTVKDKLGADKTDIDSSYYYAETHIGADIPLTDEQKLGVKAAAGYMSIKQDGFDLNTTGSGTVHYDSDTLSTAVLRAATNWKGTFDIDGYTVLPSVQLGAVYLTDTKFDTSFDFAGYRFKASDELDNFIANATVGIGFSKDNVSLEIFASQQKGSHLSSRTFNARIGYMF